MPALRSEEIDGLAQQQIEATGLPLQFERLAQIEEALEVHLDQGKLSQRDRERFGFLARRAILCMELHRQTCAGDAVAQLMGQAAGDLTEQPQSFGLPDRLLKLRQALGHLVDRSAEIAQLIVETRQRHRAEVSL